MEDKPICVKIITDHGASDKFTRYRIRIDTRFLRIRNRFFNPSIYRLVRALFNGLDFFLRARRVKGHAVVVTYASDVGFVFASIQYLCSPFLKPITHVMFDLLLDEKPTGLKGVVADIRSHIFNKAVSAAVIWGKSDVNRFANEFGLDRCKLIFHPYHITLDDIDGVDCGKYEAGDDNYIFCGGNVGRDFETVIHALGPLGYPVLIATQVPGIAEKAKDYPNISVRGVTPLEFRHLMARSTFVVEAHPAKFFRTAGHQTMLNAMYFGKPVIMADVESAEDYIEDGINGYVVPAEDLGAFAAATRKLWEDRELREQFAHRAQQKCTKPIYRTLNHIQSIYNLAIELHGRSGYSELVFEKVKIY